MHPVVRTLSIGREFDRRYGPTRPGWGFTGSLDGVCSLLTVLKLGNHKDDRYWDRSSMSALIQSNMFKWYYALSYLLSLTIDSNVQCEGLFAGMVGRFKTTTPSK